MRTHFKVLHTPALSLSVSATRSIDSNAAKRCVQTRLSNVRSTSLIFCVASLSRGFSFAFIPSYSMRSTTIVDSSIQTLLVRAQTISHASLWNQSAKEKWPKRKTCNILLLRLSFWATPSRQHSRGAFGYDSCIHAVSFRPMSVRLQTNCLSLLLMLCHTPNDDYTLCVCVWAHAIRIRVSVNVRLGACLVCSRFPTEITAPASQLRTISCRLIHSPSGCWSVRYAYVPHKIVETHSTKSVTNNWWIKIQIISSHRSRPSKGR